MERQDWAWSKIKAAIMKSLLVTGISNVFGTWEDGLIRSDTMMEGIDAQLLEVFGERSNQPPPADDIILFDDVSRDSSSDDRQSSFDEFDTKKSTK